MNKHPYQIDAYKGGILRFSYWFETAEEANAELEKLRQHNPKGYLYMLIHTPTP